MGDMCARKEIEAMGMRPKYLRHNLWAPDANPSVTVAEWTETALPLARPPLTELNHASINQILHAHPDLFRIVTPLNICELERLSAPHPNRGFVESVLEGLREGFWPWANTLKDGYPLTHDETRALRLNPAQQSFLKVQLEHEQQMSRISASFGNTLLPGMYCMPNYVVPKPHSSDWRLVNDLSAGPYSLNSMVDRQFITGYPLDNLMNLGELILRKRKECPTKKFVAWKSDISEAYRICPMHKAWQLKQVIRIDGELFVDRVNVFGGSASPAIFISVNALISWIAKHCCGIDDLAYVDDSFGLEEEGKEMEYTPYGTSFPMQQAQLLQLWDQLGVPHKQRKQIFGNPLTILGIEVDVNNLTFTLSDEAKERLVRELQESSQKGTRKKVKEWQRVAGWLNWVLNVHPLLRPALNNLYAKIRGKGQEVKVWVNVAIQDDFRWARAKLDTMSGVFLLKSLSWEIDEATCVIKADACPSGMGFWYPATRKGFTSPTPLATPSSLNNFYEALAVLSALQHCHHVSPSGSRIVIYTDSFTAVTIFSSLRALPDFNCILKAAVDVLLEGGHSLRVLHIPGQENAEADALSRGDFMRALRLQPKLTIQQFEPWQRQEHRQSSPTLQPPRQKLGAAAR